MVGLAQVAHRPARQARAGDEVAVGIAAVDRGHRPERPCLPDWSRRDANAAGAQAFDRVADIIAANSEVPREKITPDSHAIDDLGIDSLAFLDIAFAIDKAFGIKLPLEQWTQEVNEGKVPAEEYFVLRNLVSHIDALVAAKKA